MVKSKIDYRHICTAGMIAHHGLHTAHEALEAGPHSIHMRLLLIRHLVLEMANIADLATISGALYKTHPELGALHKPIRKGLEFFKYLRNVYVGHLVPDLIDKTFEWQPYANTLIGSVELEKQSFISWFTLETAINTYADPKTGHKVFTSDTDLNYPPDRTRFLNFVGDTALLSMSYADQLITIVKPYCDIPDFDKSWVDLAIKAGKTDFSVLTKRKR